jgi:hypothetical protein
MIVAITQKKSQKHCLKWNKKTTYYIILFRWNVQKIASDVWWWRNRWWLLMEWTLVWGVTKIGSWLQFFEYVKKPQNSILQNGKFYGEWIISHLKKEMDCSLCIMNSVWISFMNIPRKGKFSYLIYELPLNF